MSESRTEDVSSLLKTYENLGDMGKKDMAKKYPHIDFGKSLAGQISTDKGYQSESLGSLLISGSGRGSNAVAGWVIYELAVATLCFVVAYIWRDVAQFSPEVRIVIITILIVLGVWSTITAMIIGSAISKTVIRVYESGITGRGISKFFYLGDVRGFEFMLTYDQVSVDLNGGQIIVRDPGTHYKVYVSNGAEIQQAVHKQKSKYSR